MLNFAAVSHVKGANLHALSGSGRGMGKKGVFD